jgi:hypothetical protein
VVLMLVLLALPAAAKNGWTEEDKSEFMMGCIEEAPTRFNEEQVIQRCSCWVLAFERGFTPEELQSAVDSEDARVKHVVDSCDTRTAIWTTSR